MNFSVKYRQRELIDNSNSLPKHELGRRERPVFPAAGHKLTTRNTRLRRERADRYAIERAEGEGMIIRAV